MSLRALYARALSSEYDPLEIQLNTRGNVEAITAILQSTIEGIQGVKGQIHLVLKLKEAKQ